MVICAGRARYRKACEGGHNQPNGRTGKVFSGYDGQTTSTTSRISLNSLLPEPGHNGKPMILKRLFKRQENSVKRLYGAIVAAARHEQFYARMGVVDTIEGRFEMLVLHLFLVLNRLKGEGEEGVRQRLTDEFFADMDGSLRELGVSDVAVGKKVRKIAESYYGRVLVYYKMLSGKNELMLEALRRNIYPDGAPDGAVEAMANYFRSATELLGAIPKEQILRGELKFR